MKHKSFEEFRQELNEMAIAGWGDYKADKPELSSLTNFVIQHKYNLIDKIVIEQNEYLLFENKITSPYYVYKVGYFSDVDFKVVFECELSTKIIPKLGSFKNVESVKVTYSQHGSGISTFMYKYFIEKLKYKILGDEIQYFGARKLWTKLSKEIDVVVDIIDFNTGEVLEKNVTLYHGTNDWEFDKRVWSYDKDKHHIRLILKSIK